MQPFSIDLVRDEPQKARSLFGKARFSPLLQTAQLFCSEVKI